MKRITKAIIYLIVIISVFTASLTLLVGCDENDIDNIIDNIIPVTPIKNTSNFQSKSTNTFDDINGNTVTVDLFERNSGEALNNPNVGEAILLYQCIKYKEAHPEEDVEITFTSFHISVVTSACLKRDSKYFGYMKALYDSEYDSNGFVRISYLLVYSAKIGINVTVVGQIDASGVEQQDGYKADYSFDEYFTSHLSDEAVDGKTVGDFMTFKRAHWTAYGDKAASDMMHVKSCTVSHYIDKNGVEHGAGVWLSSTNLDGIDKNGANGNDGIQTGAIISDHEAIRNVVSNYVKLMAQHCGQEEINTFRDMIVRMNTEQIDLIEAGRGNEIPVNERIVYLGTDTDDVFEFYFTPFGGSSGTWDTVHNPYAKYISKLLPYTSGAGSITFAWNNVKYLTNFEFSHILTDILITAFTQNARLTNKLYLNLPGIDASQFDNLVEGENIGRKRVRIQWGNHAKDFQLSYIENLDRKYVTVLNSLNFHQGSMSYQTNTVLVIKETKKTGNNVYVNFGKEVSGYVISESDRIAKSE